MKLPVLITRGITIFPATELSLDIGRDISINAIELANAEKEITSDIDKTFDNLILVVPQKNDEDVIKTTDQFYQFGTLAQIIDKKKLVQDNIQGFSVTLLGQWRVSLNNCEFDENKKTFIADFEKIPNRNNTKTENISLKEKIVKTLKELKTTNNEVFNLTDEQITDWNNEANFAKFVDLVASKLNFGTEINI